MYSGKKFIRRTSSSVENFKQYQPYNVNLKRCLLCLNEKLQIPISRGNNMLNTRTEIISKCRHRNKHALVSYDSMNWNIKCKCFIKFLKFVVIWFIVLWSSLTETSSISINFKGKSISCDILSMRNVLLFTWIPFAGLKEIFPYLVLWRHSKNEIIIS